MTVSGQDIQKANELPKVQKAYDVLSSDEDTSARVRRVRFTVFSKEQHQTFTDALTGSGCYWTCLADPDPARGVGILVSGSREQLLTVLGRILGS